MKAENKICVECGGSFLTTYPHRILCFNKECARKRHNRAGENFKARMKKDRRCLDCGNVIEPRKKRCRHCLDKDAERRNNNFIKHRNLYMYENAKRRAKDYGLKFDIAIDDIVIPEFCPIFGIKLESGKGVIQDSSPTLDKIIPKNGYVRGNIAVISRRANRLKNNATLEELVLLGEWAKCHLA